MGATGLAGRGLALRPGEGRAFAWSFLYFFLLLGSYFMVRPLRDSQVAGLGADEIKYLSTAVFFVMLAIVPAFGWVASRLPRTRLIPGVYAFVVANLLAFAVAFRADPGGEWTARVFYVWLSAYNLFVVSVFWSFMADLWREEQGRRLFGVIAAVLWAATTVLVRKSALSQASAETTLAWQLGVSALLLPLAAWALGEPGIVRVDGVVLASLLFQSVVVAFASYLAWFWLLTRYLAGRLAVFSFLAPLFGVVFGVLILGDTLSLRFVLAAALVGVGIALVNLRR